MAVTGGAHRPVVTLDLSPAVHRRAGMGRHAQGLLDALVALEDDRLAFQIFYAGAKRAEPVGAAAILPRHTTNLDYKPWRLLAMASHLGRRPLDGFYGRPAIVHATDHLLPHLRARSLFTLHDLIFELFPQHHRRYNYWFLKLMMPRFLRAADRIVTVSEQSRSDAVRLYGIDPERVTVIHNGVESHFRPAPAAAGEDRAALDRYSLPARYLLHVGTIEPRKNLIRLLEAFGRVRESHPTLKLVLVGQKGWLYEPFFEALARSGLEEHVLLPGYVSDADLPALYRQAACFVFPTVYEGFGLPALEALACGTPVVASRSSSLPEVTGGAALLVDPYDPAAIAAAIRRVLEDEALAARLRDAGPRRAAVFTWEAAARRTLTLYLELLGQHGRPNQETTHA